MKTFNITAQAYNRQDKDKQTMLMNDIIIATSKENAIITFTTLYDLMDHAIVKIYSVEEIFQVAS